MPSISAEEYQRNRDLQSERASIGNKVKRFFTKGHGILYLIWGVGLVSLGVALSLWASKEEVVSLLLSSIVSIGVCGSIIIEKNKELERCRESFRSLCEDYKALEARKKGGSTT